MKKIYVTPVVQATRIKARNMIATSILHTNVTGLGVEQQGTLDADITSGNTKERGDYDNGSWSDGLW
jgi:hypothetical protein